ncbi:unnamed protein product [Cuscuta epithymum]|uniref:Trichome birefringence-like N-terminal domain-containing protein n=1 Tax=Cuscuta epithymum TaxID=186058 RepID=A0AAV0ELV5_9ASTE|nr:unnamed protein product [Cuscuta epithymum]
MVVHGKRRQRCVNKESLLGLKLGLSVLVAVSFVYMTALFSGTISRIVESGSHFLDDALASTRPLRLLLPQAVDLDFPQGNAQVCDLFTGDWIHNPDGPYYTNETCNFIEAHQNCMKNGRPDTNYLYWRWKPRDCSLPRFNAKKFLELMRGKTWALIGDSISRNHVQSILCMLSKVEQPVEVYHDEEFRSRRWFFSESNFTISVIWSPFLAEADIFEDFNGVSTSEVELHLDKLDKKWSQHFHTFDYVIFSSGKWFVKSTVYFKGKTLLGCHNCPKRNLTQLGFEFAYREVLRNVFSFILSSSKKQHKGMILFRTSTSDHFENGEWHTGGNCKRTEPAKEGELERSETHKILRRVELQEFEKLVGDGSEKGVKLKLFDVSPLSLLRRDGHPGPYRFFQPFAGGKSGPGINDCLHWCLPGPIDSWNDLMMEMVLRGRGADGLVDF